VPNSRKLLVLAIDAANPGLLQSWAGDGTLPHLASLMASGLTAGTKNVEALFVGATWPSFTTALTPGGHGIYWLDILKRGTYEIRRCGAAELGRRKTFWEILSDAGQRVIVMDVPLARRSPGLNGIQIVEWGTHDPAFGFQTTPKRLGETILRHFGPHPAPRMCDVPGRSPGECRELSAQLVQGAALRARLTNKLLCEETWDMAIQVFSEAHCGGHQLWHCHDPQHPGFDGSDSGVGDLLRDVYVSVDRAIGEVLSAQGPDTTVVVMTLHGMARMHGYHYLTPDILLRLGLMRRASAGPEGAPAAAAGAAGAGSGLRSLYRRIPVSIRGPLYELRQQVLQRFLGRGRPIDVDPAGSRCFDVGLGPTLSAIRLNLQGREPAGTVAPGADADDLCRELTDRFMELTHPETGARLVHRVLRSAELFPGPYLAELPDILIEWSEDPAVGSTRVGTGAGATLRAASPAIGELEYLNTYCRSGDHRIEGMFIARGPGIAPGRLDRVVSTMDLAPTFTKLLGSEMPAVHGRPIPELLPR
jgi:predicted AlkP superfamily phosphohydrolase/phosphomutase